MEMAWRIANLEEILSGHWTEVNSEANSEIEAGGLGEGTLDSTAAH